jgi:hypothetical protein
MGGFKSKWKKTGRFQENEGLKDETAYFRMFAEWDKKCEVEETSECDVMLFCQNS